MSSRTLSQPYNHSENNVDLYIWVWIRLLYTLLLGRYMYVLAIIIVLLIYLKYHDGLTVEVENYTIRKANLKVLVSQWADPLRSWKGYEKTAR